jgi:molybdopterin-guanine dinucleotide biosynthesis protein A
MDRWYADLKVVEVAFDDQDAAFRNINTREDLAQAAHDGATSAR